MPDKPVPQSSTFQGCPPQGDGGDPKLNMLKNRIDEGNYVPVTFDSILDLSWPKTTERRPMDSWSAEDAAAIAKYEGIPVRVEGFIWGARQSGTESTNGHATSAAMNDWHVWFTKTAGEDRTHAAHSRSPQAEYTMKAVREMLSAGQSAYPGLQVSIRKIEEDTHWDEEEGTG